ncbi:ribonuclease H-like domain-containing protein [Tanacetum coccineum]|uniref:Ribonuclease H-like domain-containing protein n=1 Tax=Tanacetum coccineum TaxID=301880 RepID=A0ABQ5FRC6_9ASTR
MTLAEHHIGSNGGAFNNRALHALFASEVFPYGSIQPTSTPNYTFLDDSPDIITQPIRSTPIAPPTVLQPEVAPITPHNTPIDTPNHTAPNNGTLSRYKARLVANGSIQLEGVDVDETFSPVVKPGTIRIILSLTASRHWPIHLLVVKNAFLHGDLSETVYMHQPLWFRDSVHPDYVCLLQRSLYRLKQAPRAWF